MILARAGLDAQARGSLLICRAQTESVNPTSQLPVQMRPTAALSQSRRMAIESLFAISLGGMHIPGAADAADLNSFITKVFPPQPEPVMFPRKALDQRFAVLLMRSSYEAVDQLDFIPMDKFQMYFWKLRQSEVEAYNLQYQPLKVRQGDLTDPLYFDFISFSQYATISREMPKGLQVFKEFCEDCPDQKRLVQRNPALADNSQLPQKFYELTGDMIYVGLRDGFRDEVFGAPMPLTSSSSVLELAGNIQKILDIMVDRGYALKAEVSDVSEQPPSFTIKLQGSANLWGVAALSSRRASVVTAFDAMVIQAYLRASGRQATYELSYNDVGVEETWTLV